MNLSKTAMDAFWKLHRSVVRPNARFNGIHAGETCLLFGNGGSLKYFDFSAILPLPAIACAYSPVDKRLAAVDVRYWVLPDPYNMYPFVFNHRAGTFQRNVRLPWFKKLMLRMKDKTIFTSLTNYYSFIGRMGNVNYFHHFGDRSSFSHDLAGTFGACAGSLDIMIGMARYLGFSKAILLGCDYLGSPKLEGHFYADAKPFVGKDDPNYAARIVQVAGDFDVLAVFPKGISCPVFPSASFSEYFGGEEVYRANHEIIEKDDLDVLRQAARLGHIYM